MATSIMWPSAMLEQKLAEMVYFHQVWTSFKDVLFFLKHELHPNEKMTIKIIKPDAVSQKEM